jgi:hypothetical protein
MAMRLKNSVSEFPRQPPEYRIPSDNFQYSLHVFHPMNWKTPELISSTSFTAQANNTSIDYLHYSLCLLDSWIILKAIDARQQVAVNWRNALGVVEKMIERVVLKISLNITLKTRLKPAETPSIHWSILIIYPPLPSGYR